MRYLLPVLLLLSLFAPMLVLSADQLGSVDCSNLLILLERMLKSVTSEALNFTTLEAVASANVSGELGILHRSTYEELLELLGYLRKAAEGNLSPREARELAARINILAVELRDSTVKYERALATCSHDPTLSTTLSNRIEQLLNELVEDRLPTVTQLLLSQSTGGLFEVRLGKSTYRAGEPAELVIRPLREGVEVVDAYISLWPSLTRVANVSISREGLEYLGRFRAPNLSTLTRYYGPSGVPRVVALVAVVEALDSLSEGMYRGYALFTVEFDYPRVDVVAPRTLYLGDVLELSVSSDGLYRVRIGIGGAYVLNTTITPGVNIIRLNTSALNITYGTHLIRVEVEPTEERVGYVVTRSFLVMPRTPKVDVRVPSLLISVDGYATIEVLSRDLTQRELNVLVSVGGAVRGSYNLNESLMVRTFLSYLPVFVGEVSVTVASTALGYEPVTIRKEVICVNPVTSVAVAAASMFVAALLHERERGFVLLLRSSGPRKLTGIALTTRSTILEASYRISSRIAELYYSTLRKLHLPMPEASETLREHFARLALGQKLKSLLWRLMLIAEKDLYSGRKQDYKEALKLSEEVMRSGK